MKLQSTDKLLLPAVMETLASLKLGPEHAALARLAELLAREIDEMDGERRTAMLAQTAGLLHRVLDTLSKGRVAPRANGALQRLRDARPA